MKLITLNAALPPWSLTRKRRLPFILSAICNENPDIVFLQEIFFQQDAKRLIRNFKNSSFFYSYYSKDLLTISRFALEDCLTFEFKEQGPFLSWAILDRLYKKAFQAITIEITNSQILLVNTHTLSACGHDSGIYQKVRKGQAVQICDYVEKQNQARIIVTGDFNVENNSPSIRVFREQYQYADPLENVSGNTFRKRQKRIDYFFIKGFSPAEIRSEIIFKEDISFQGELRQISDHCGILLEIKETK